MNDDQLTKIIDSINTKVGAEVSATIADDLGMLITCNSEALKDLNDRNKQIEDLKSRNEKLVSANGNLLKRIPKEKDFEEEEEKKEVPKNGGTISLRDAFDSKGNFLK